MSEYRMFSNSSRLNGFMLRRLCVLGKRFVSTWRSLWPGVIGYSLLVLPVALWALPVKPSLTASGHHQIISSAALSLYGDAAHLGAEHLPYANPAAPKGGEFSTQFLGTFDTFNALNDQGTAVYGTAYLSDSLLTASLDEPAVSYGLLADQITRDPDDPSWIIFHINPKAYFANHDPVTADDVVFTFDTILKNGAPGLRSYYQAIRHVTALDAHTVRFDFEPPKTVANTVSKTALKMSFAVGQMAILSRKDWVGRDFRAISRVPPLGSGPYRVAAVDWGRSITYARNPDYWARDLMVNRGKYNVDRIRYVYFRDQDAAFEAFKAGVYTFRVEDSDQHWQTGYQFPAVKQGMVTKCVLPSGNPIPMMGLVFNLRRPAFADWRVRQALSLAFDFESLNRRLFAGSYHRLQSFFDQSELAATGQPSRNEMDYLSPLLSLMNANEQQAVLVDWHPPQSQGDGFNRENLLKARALLLAAGYHDQHGVLVDQHGQPYHIDLLIQDAIQQRILLPYVRMLARLGITASIRLVDVPQYESRIRRFDFDLVIATFPQTLTPGSEQHGYWASNTAQQRGSLNLAGIRSPAVDALLGQLDQATSRAQVVAMTRALDRVLRAQDALIPLYGLAGVRVAFWSYYQAPDILPRYDLGLDYWWVDPVRYAAVQRAWGR